VALDLTSGIGTAIMNRAVLICALLLSLVPVAATAQSLAEAMTACEAFVANRAIPDTVDSEFTLFGDFDYATVETEVGPVLLTFAAEYGTQEVTYCDLMGTDPRDEDGPTTVTWAAALPMIETWFAARAAEGDGKVLPYVGDQRMFAVCREDGGYFISAQPGLIGDRHTGLPQAEWPLYVRINEWSGNAAKPCDF
jgi:hypothetical protein